MKFHKRINENHENIKIQRDNHENHKNNEVTY